MGSYKTSIGTIGEDSKRGCPKYSPALIEGAIIAFAGYVNSVKGCIPLKF